MFTDKEVMLRLLLSLILGGLIGLERQLHRRAAGLRTHILVCLGSCLIMLTSMYVFDIYKGIVSLDPSRIAAGVITGIGFLGAGAIIRESEGIKGLTTAASLWVVAGIGLSTGCGFYIASFFTTLLALIVLLFLGRIEKELLGKE
jgi:putative Mg2+ transporter-C (MgtC) family protein